MYFNQNVKEYKKCILVPKDEKTSLIIYKIGELVPTKEDYENLVDYFEKAEFHGQEKPNKNIDDFFQYWKIEIVKHLERLGY